MLLADKTEAGWYYVPDRGFDIETNTRHGEFNPEHVHHNYLHTDVYEKSRKDLGVLIRLNNLMKRLEVAEYLSQKPVEEPKPMIIATRGELDKTDARIL